MAGQIEHRKRRADVDRGSVEQGLLAQKYGTGQSEAVRPADDAFVFLREHNAALVARPCVPLIIQVRLIRADARDPKAVEISRENNVAKRRHGTDDRAGVVGLVEHIIVADPRLGAVIAAYGIALAVQLHGEAQVFIGNLRGAVVSVELGLDTSSTKRLFEWQPFS